MDELLGMTHDNWPVGDYSIMCDVENVTIEAPGEHISVPREAFNKLIAEYLKERPVKPAEKHLSPSERHQIFREEKERT